MRMGCRLADQAHGLNAKFKKKLLQPPTKMDIIVVYIWNNWLHVKTNVFGWRTIQERNPTRKAIINRHIHFKSAL